MKTYTTEELEALLSEAGEVLAQEGLSFAIVLSAPSQLQEGIKPAARPLAMNAFRVVPTQSSNLLNAIWMSVGRYFTTYSEIPVTNDLQPHFSAGAAVAEATAMIMAQQHQMLMGAMEQTENTGELN